MKKATQRTEAKNAMPTSYLDIYLRQIDWQNPDTPPRARPANAPVKKRRYMQRGRSTFY